MELNQRTLIIGGVLAVALVVLALQLMDPVYVVLILAVVALGALVAWSRVRGQAIADEEADWEAADEWGLATDDPDDELIDLDDRLAGFLATDDRPARHGLFADEPRVEEAFVEDDAAEETWEEGETWEDEGSWEEQPAAAVWEDGETDEGSYTAAGSYDDTAATYDDTPSYGAAAYEDTPATYEDTAATYEDTAATYEDTAATYDDTPSYGAASYDDTPSYDRGARYDGAASYGDAAVDDDGAFSTAASYETGYDSDTLDEEYEELVEEYAAESPVAEYVEDAPTEPPARERKPSIFAAPGIIDEARVTDDDAILEASRASQVKYDEVLTREDANAETREILSRVASLLAKYE